MNASNTAILLIGFQNDYFSPDGILRGFLEDHGRVDSVRERAVRLAARAAKADVLVISTPIVFQEGYPELVDPVGILKTIREVGAFKQGTHGGAMVKEIASIDGLTIVPGKRGLNAFSNTSLDEHLRSRGVTEVVLAGVVTSVCIDSTGRAAFDRGYSVTVLSDCTAGRSSFEQDFYCREVFPIYARVKNSDEALATFGS